MTRGDLGLLRRGWRPRQPVCWTWAQVGGPSRAPAPTETGERAADSRPYGVGGCGAPRRTPSVSGTPTAPVCALGTSPFRGGKGSPSLPSSQNSKLKTQNYWRLIAALTARPCAGRGRGRLPRRRGWCSSGWCGCGRSWTGAPAPACASGWPRPRRCG